MCKQVCITGSILLLTAMRKYSYIYVVMTDLSGELTVAFIYERIPEADIVAFGLREIDKQFPMSVASRWVIDRERNFYFLFHIHIIKQ